MKEYPELYYKVAAIKITHRLLFSVELGSEWFKGWTKNRHKQALYTLLCEGHEWDDTWPINK